MGMHTNIRGIKLPDAKWKMMKAVYDSCRNAGLEIPGEVNAYFGFETPNERGVVVDLTASGHGVEFVDSRHPESGYRVDVRRLDKDIAFIEFENSW